MRFFIDTEFIDTGREIELISIGIVSGSGREYYAESLEVDWTKSTPWIDKNVVPFLVGGSALKMRSEIATEVALFMGEGPEIWAYYGSYDWISLCQLYGRMMDIPKGWPFYVKDIKMLADMLGNPRLPDKPRDNHNALADANWAREAHMHLDRLRRVTEAYA